MQAREVKTEVEITEEKCKVKSICDIWRIARHQTGCVDKLASSQTFSYYPWVIRFKKIVHCQLVLY